MPVSAGNEDLTCHQHRRCGGRGVSNAKHPLSPLLQGGRGGGWIGEGGDRVNAESVRGETELLESHPLPPSLPDALLSCSCNRPRVITAGVSSLRAGGSCCRPPSWPQPPPPYL